MIWPTVYIEKMRPVPAVKSAAPGKYLPKYGIAVTAPMSEPS